MTTVEVLKAARALYAANPSHAPSGSPVPSGEYCPSNAIYELTPEGGFNAAYSALATAMCGYQMTAGNCAVPRWNAEHSTADVLEAFDRAIAAEEAS